MKRSVVSWKKIAIAERREIVLDLRKQGHDLRAIARILGEQYGISCSRQTVHRDLTHMLGKVIGRTMETAEQVLRLELMRLDDLQQAFWLAAVGGYLPDLPDNSALMEDLVAQEAGESVEGLSSLIETEDKNLTRVYVLPDEKKAKIILDIMARRAKLLGLDKIEMRVGDPDGRPLSTAAGSIVAGLGEAELDDLIGNLIAVGGVDSEET